MTAKTLTYQPPILPSPFDATNTNSVQPVSSKMSTGFLDGTDVVDANAYNFLHNSTTCLLYIMQELGLVIPYNPSSGGGSQIACPQGGIVSVSDSVTSDTQFYVALNNRPIGFADPSTDATNFGYLNFANLSAFQNPDPVGKIIIWPSALSVPAGFLQCPTSATYVSATSYYELAFAIGSTWGGSAITNATALVKGNTYVILTAGTTNYMSLFGASSNAVGTVFTAGAAGSGSSGTGTVYASIALPTVINGYTFVQGTVAAVTHGALLAHTHPPLSPAGNFFGGGTGSSPTGTLTGATTSTTGSTGGTDNLAAGLGVQFLIKYA